VKETETQREKTDRHTHTETERERKRDRERETDRERERDRERDRERSLTSLSMGDLNAAKHSCVMGHCRQRVAEPLGQKMLGCLTGQWGFCGLDQRWGGG